MHKRALAHTLAKMLCLALVAVLVTGLDFSSTRLPRARAAPYVIYVKGDATGTGDGSSWGDAYTDLQLALNAAYSGDEVWVAAGTYRPSSGNDRTATFQMESGVALYGGFSGGERVRERRDWKAYVTILSGDIGTAGDNSDNSYHVVTGSEADETAVLDGFTVTGGNADGNLSEGYNLGAGMYNEHGSPTVANCTFDNNTAAWDGGGIYSYGHSDLTLTNCTFSANSAGWFGGGMFNWVSDPALVGCTFDTNSARRGGGMYNWVSDAILDDCTFTGNSAVEHGGGILNWIGHVTLARCIFEGNSAIEHGGGLYLLSGETILTNNVIASNEAGISGSALSAHASAAQVLHVTMAQNEGGDGSAVYLGGASTVALTNTILAGHTVGISVTAGNTCTLEGTLWYGNQQNLVGAGTILTGAVTVYGDPAFVAAGAGDYHVGPLSAAIDAGVDAGMRGDVDREIRPYQTPDLGADEYWPPGLLRRLYWPLALKGPP
jgi:parallel beta-helix repeat protein